MLNESLELHVTFAKESNNLSKRFFEEKESVNKYKHFRKLSVSFQGIVTILFEKDHMLIS